jgi:hypothetical protein
MNFIGGILTLLMAAVVLLAPRRFAVLGVFGAVCYITQGQALNLGGFHFHAIRIVLLVGFIRILTRGELRKLKMTSIDWVLIAYAILTYGLMGLRTGVWQEPVGRAYDVLLSYFVIRCLVTSFDDLKNLSRDLALFIIPMALCMILESWTGKNVFDSMGGHDFESQRAGRYRCVGAFRGPHTAGAFAATLLPLFVGLFFVRRSRWIAVAGLIAATAITYTANASGALMAYLGSLVGLVLWRSRKDMRKIRWAIVASVVAWGFFVKAPIWYIPSKISDLTGGDGCHTSWNSVTIIFLTGGLWEPTRLMTGP